VREHNRHSLSRLAVTLCSDIEMKDD
jgi:hypothetical protein